MLEAIYETSTGYRHQNEIYNRFCDRLELRKTPFLSPHINGAYSLEMPFPRGYLFTIDEDNYKPGQAQDASKSSVI